MEWPDNAAPRHRCQAIGCRRSVPRRWPMCRRHWLAVPPHLQARVYAAWGGHGWKFWPLRTAVRAAALALHWSGAQ